MKFNQKPGIYNAKNDRLIINFSDALKKELILDGTKTSKYNIHLSSNKLILLEDNNSIIIDSEKIKKPFYIILPDNITVLDNCCFQQQNNLIGIYGKNVKMIDVFTFKDCNNIEEIELPNLEYIEACVFPMPSPFYDKYKKEENGLITVKDNLIYIDREQIKGDTLVIPNNIKAIQNDLFSNPFYFGCASRIVLPTKLDICDFHISGAITEVVLPIDFKMLNLSTLPFTELIYKGSEKYLEKTTNKSITELKRKFSNLKIEPYTVEELEKFNFSIEKIESILNKKLTLEELLNIGKSFKEVNNYLKESVTNYEL